MDPYQDRNEAFGQGTVPQNSPGLQQSATSQNAAVPQQMIPTSPLHQLMRSANGLGTMDANRRLLGGRMLETSNGFGSQTYQEKRPFLSTTLSA